MVAGDTPHFDLPGQFRVVVDACTRGVDLIAYVDGSKGDDLALLPDDRVRIGLHDDLALRYGGDRDLTRAGHRDGPIGRHLDSSGAVSVTGRLVRGVLHLDLKGGEDVVGPRHLHMYPVTGLQIGR